MTTLYLTRYGIVAQNQRGVLKLLLLLLLHLMMLHLVMLFLCPSLHLRLLHIQMIRWLHCQHLLILSHPLCLLCMMLLLHGTLGRPS
jgi:hypothetical protein